VGCQNYDDQFDDLNAQISALKSQVDGLSSLSGQVSSLSGTISGLSSGVAAAQAAATAAGASADAATAAANAIDLSGLSASLATLQTEVDAVQASLATAATASAVTALQAELDAIEVDLDELLSTSNIYSTDVSVTNATTLSAALALGNKINVLNASMTITGFSGMSYTDVQTLVNRVNTTTGNITYAAYSSTGTEITFNNLVSAANITMTQPKGYSFPKLVTAAEIDLRDDYETTVTNISFPVLTSATSIETDTSSGDFEVIFTYATNVDFGSLVTAPSNTVTITTKKDATLDLGAWVSKDAAGNHVNATVALNGPASFTNGTAAGTFASTGLPGNTLGASDGAITLTNVATAAIHNFRGDITLNAGVKNFTGNNIVRLGTASGGATITAATALETLTVTQIRDNDPSNSAATNTANGKSSEDDQDILVTSAHAKLTSVTITGKTGDVKFTSAPVLTTVNLTGADAFDVSASGNAALTSWTDASKAEDRVFNDNDAIATVSLSATTTMTVTGDKAVGVSVDGNAELATLTLGMDDVDDLDITSNPKLATISGATALKDNGTSAATDVKIYANALVASLVRDTKEAPSATVVAGATSDTGSITTASGIKDLDAFLTDAIAASGTVSVWFDTVQKLEVQASYGGTYTDTTSSLTAPSAVPTSAEAADFSSNYTGFYAYAYQLDAVGGTTSTSGARNNQFVTYTHDVGRNAATYTDKALATNEGFTIVYTGGTTTWKQGDTYNGTTVSTVDQLVAYMNADSTLDALGIDIQADRDAWHQTLLTMTYEKSATNGLANIAGVTSGTGNIAYNIPITETGLASLIYAPVAASGNGVDALSQSLMETLNKSGDAYGRPGDNGNQILVVRNVSGGSVSDRSPIPSSFSVTPVIDAAQTSTTVQLLNSTGTISNTLAQGSNNFNFDVAETALSGIRVTLKNVGTGAFATTVSLHATAVSNTAIKTDTSKISTGGLGGTHIDSTPDLLDSGNAPTYANNANLANYLTTYAQITAGTTVTETAAVTAVTTNRTGW
jgi:hypothetical protein